jgi:hypothetical protein
MMPNDPATFPGCPFTGANAFNATAQQTAFSWALAQNHEAAWQRHPHVSKKGFLPLEHWTKGRGDK